MQQVWRLISAAQTCWLVRAHSPTLTVSKIHFPFATFPTNTKLYSTLSSVFNNLSMVTTVQSFDILCYSFLGELVLLDIVVPADRGTIGPALLAWQRTSSKDRPTYRTRRVARVVFWMQKGWWAREFWCLAGKGFHSAIVLEWSLAWHQLCYLVLIGTLGRLYSIEA